MRSTIRIAAGAGRWVAWPALWVAERLAAAGHACELVDVADSGEDAAPDASGVGIAVAGQRAALRAGRADLAVHAFEDLPAAPAAGLEIAAVPARGPAHDVVLLHPRAGDPDRGALPLATAARVDAGPARRVTQLSALRPDLRPVEARGGVPERVARLRAGDLDALVLAAARLDRLALDLTGLQRVDLDPAAFLPAPGQGALALEIRRGDPLGDALTDLHDVRGYPLVAAERGLLGLLEADRQPALGAHARRDGPEIVLDAWLDGRRARGRHPTAEGAAVFALEGLGGPGRGGDAAFDPHTPTRRTA